jgi:hypothetical protein
LYLPPRLLYINLIIIIFSFNLFKISDPDSSTSCIVPVKVRNFLDIPALNDKDEVLAASSGLGMMISNKSTQDQFCITLTVKSAVNDCHFCKYLLDESSHVASI